MTTRIKTDSARGRIRALLSDGIPRGRREIAEALDMLPRDASAQISQMVKRSMLFKDAGNGRDYMHRYSDRPIEPTTPIESRTCNVCGQKYPLTPEHFYAQSSVHGGKKRGLMYTCKPCHKARSAEKAKVSKPRYHDDFAGTHEGRVLIQPTPGGCIVRFGAQWRPNHNPIHAGAWAGYESTLCRCE